MRWSLYQGVAVMDLERFSTCIARLAAFGDPVAAHLAMVTPSPLITTVKKKAGSNVFQGGRSSIVTRKHAIPRQPRTPAQLAVRGNFSTNSKYFSGAMDAAHVAEWNAAAATLLFTNRLGQKFVPTGIQLYQQTSRNLQAAGLVPLIDPVVPLVTAGPVSVSVTISIGGAEIDVAVGSPPSGTQIPVLRLSKVVPTGKTKIGKKVFQVSVAAAGDPGPYNLWAFQVPALTMGQIGMNLFAGVRYVDNVTGGGSLEVIGMGAIAA